MSESFSSTLKELDELCDSSKYVGVYSNPILILEVVKESFCFFTKLKEKQTRLSVDRGSPQAILQSFHEKVVDADETTPSSSIPLALLSPTLIRMREVESDHSLAHMMERFSNSESVDYGFEQNFLSLLEKGETAPQHEALSLLLLAIKVALCHENQKLQHGKIGDFLARLQRLRIIHPKELVKNVRTEVNRRQTALLSSPLSWMSVAGARPQLISTEDSCSVLAHGEIGVLSLTDAFQCMGKQFSVRVSCAGAFQIGWVPRGARFSENVDLRTLEGSFVYDGFSIWSEKKEHKPLLSRPWCEGELISCSMESDGLFRFSRNGDDCGLALTIPTSYGRWQPVVSLVKDTQLFKSYEGIYPAVCESLFHRSLYLESQPLLSWSWGKHSIGVEVDTNCVSTTSGSASYVLGSTSLSSGIHQWSLHLTGDCSEVKFGVASEDCFQCLDKLSHCKESLLWANGKDSGQFTQSGRRKKRDTIATFKSGDTLQVEVDIVAGKISFGNNKSIVKVVTEIRSCGWVPVVYFTKLAKVRLLNQHYFPVEKDPALSKSSRRHQLHSDARRTQSVTAKSNLMSLLRTCAVLSGDQGVVVDQQPGVVNQSGDFSLSVWVRLDAEQCTTSPWLSFLLKGNDQASSRMPGLFVSARDRSLALCVSTATDWNTTLRSMKPLENGKWTHIGVSCRSKLCELFIDGVLDNSEELATPPLHNKDSWYIGKCPPGVKKPCADYPGIRGVVASLLYGECAVDVTKMAYIASSPPTVGLDFVLKDLTRPSTRLRFGVGATVSVSSRALPRAFTIEALVIAKSLPEKQNCLVSQGSSEVGGCCFGVTHSGSLFIQGFKRELITGESKFVVPGRLHHVAVVVNNNTNVRFFVDGFAAGKGVLSTKGFIETPFSPLIIGATVKGWTGDVLDVRVWHEARSQSHIASGMSRNVPRCFKSMVLKGKPQKCNKDHPLVVADDSVTFCCRDCQVSGKQGDRWWCAQCAESTCFDCCADSRCATATEPIHWLRFTEGHGSNTYDASIHHTGRLSGGFAGSFEWVTTPIKEEEEIAEQQSLTLKAHTSPSSSSSSLVLVSDTPLLLLETLASVAKSFEKADIVEKSGFGIGMQVKPPRQAVFPFVTTFNLLYSLIGQLHEAGSSSQAMMHVLELLASNLYAITSAHFADRTKTGLGLAATTNATSFCDRLLQRVREVALQAPPGDEHAIHESGAHVIAVGIPIFFPDHARRRAFLSQLLSENDKSSLVQLEHVCRHICDDLELARGLLVVGEGEESEGVSPMDLIKKLLDHTKNGIVGASSLLLLLLQQIVLGMVPIDRSQTVGSLKPTPVLHSLNNSSKTTNPLEDDLKEMTMGSSIEALMVDAGTVTHQGTSSSWASIRSEDKFGAGSGCHTFYFRILNKGDCDICVGFSGEEFDPTVMLGSNKRSVGWHLQGALHCGGKRTGSVKQTPVINGRLISIQIDTIASSTMVVLRDGDKEFIVIEMGQVMESLLRSGGLVSPAVSLNQPGQSVSLLRHQVSTKSSREISPQMVMSISHMDEFLLPYCGCVFNSFLGELDSEVPSTIPSRPLFRVLKSLLSSLLLNPSLMSAVADLSAVRGLLRVVESIRVKMSNDSKFGVMDELEELIILLSLTGAEEATRLIGCDLSKRIEERPDRLLEAGFKDKDVPLLNPDDEVFLRAVIEGSDLANTLRSCVVTRIGSRPFQQLAAQGEEIAEALRVMTAAVLYHAGALSMALDTARRIYTLQHQNDEGVVQEKIADVKLNRLLIKVYEAEKSIRIWCRQQKNAKKVDYKAQASVLSAKMFFLLDLMPRLEDDNEEAQLSVVEQVLKFGKGSGNDNLEHLRSQITTCVELAKDRLKGLNVAKELLRFDDLPTSARGAIVTKFKFFRKDSTSLHYLDGFHYAGLDARSGLKTSFDGLFMRLGKELESSVELGDIDLQLVLLNAWAMRLKPEDHSLLYHARLFDTLHLMLQQQEDFILDSYSHIKKLKLLKKAALKLVVLLATQVATQGEIGQSSSLFSGSLPPLMPAALKKQNSGSSTFTDSVFQLLHQELFSSLSVMKTEAIRDPSSACDYAKPTSTAPLMSASTTKSKKPRAKKSR